MVKKSIYGVFFLTLMTGGCRKLLDTPSPQNQVTAATVFSNDANAEEALTGLYIQVMTGSRTLLNGGMSVYGGLSSDELANTSPNPYIDPFRENELTAGNIYNSSLYSTAYNIIFTANSLIAGLNASTGVSPAVKAELRGEAEIIRALEYFYLVNLYGGVPLVTSIDFSVTERLPRDPVVGIYSQIETDLEDATQVLSTTYPGTGARTRPNRLAAMALLARMWLYRGEWMMAEAAADTVIGSGLYQLETGLDSVFRAGSQEAIWQFQPVDSLLETADAATFVPGRPGFRPAYELTSDWLEVVEAGDQRRVDWVDSVVVLGKTYFYPYKYKLTSLSPADTEYNMVIRLAEVYLIRAEARAQLANIGGAQSDLNLVRARAGLAPTTASDEVSLLTAILHERRVELVAEWGHRWLDLKRTGMADAVLGSEKPGWVGTDSLYPIPAQQLTANPVLVQNPGYR
jgi:starch-binding outer membrane protein, SusD/RagB family